MEYLQRQLRRIRTTLGISASSIYNQMIEELGVTKCSSLSQFHHFTAGTRKTLKIDELVWLEKYVDSQQSSCEKYEAFIYRITNRDGVSNENR